MGSLLFTPDKGETIKVKWSPDGSVSVGSHRWSLKLRKAGAQEISLGFPIEGVSTLSGVLDNDNASGDGAPEATDGDPTDDGAVDGDVAPFATVPVPPTPFRGATPFYGSAFIDPKKDPRDAAQVIFNIYPDLAKTVVDHSGNFPATLKARDVLVHILLESGVTSSANAVQAGTEEWAASFMTHLRVLSGGPH